MGNYEIELLQPVNEEKVYHYTSINALKSILESRSLHLSQISYSNDSTEFIDGNVFFWERWLPVAMKKETSGSLLERIKRYENFKRAAITIGREQNLCFLSFCSGQTSGDLLSQWRAYAQDGFGVALAFDVSVLKSLCEENSFSFGQCFYSEEEKMGACNRLYAQLLKEEFKDDKEFGRVLLLHLAIFSSFSKNEHFLEEKEVRIATHPSIELTVKEASSGLAVYYHLDISTKIANLIKEVVIGPCQINRYNEMSKALGIILKKAGIDDCKITRSVIPYRVTQ